MAAVSTLLNTFFSSSNLAVFFSLRNPFYTQEHGSWDVSFALEHHGLKQSWPWDDLDTLTPFEQSARQLFPRVSGDTLGFV